MQIEGNSFSEEKISNIIKGKTVFGTMREIQEVKGAIEAYDNIENYDYKSEKELLQAHKFLMKNLLDNAGAYRRGNVAVGGVDGVTHVAPLPDIVPSLMGNLFVWIQNTDDNLLIASCVFHYEFEFIHPFSDGNGRVGRLWQSVILNRYKNIFSAIPIESVVAEYQEQYHKALEDAGSAGESTPFIEFMLEVIYKTLKKLKKEDVPKNVPKNVPIKRLDDILKLIKKENNTTVSQIANMLGMADKTIQRDITNLKKDGKIKRVGSARKGHWEIVDKPR